MSQYKYSKKKVFSDGKKQEGIFRLFKKKKQKVQTNEKHFFFLKKKSM